jgi:hypothetical protein
MKRLFQIACILIVFLLAVSCSKDKDIADDSNSNIVENQIKAKIDGVDTVFTITKATLHTYSDHKQLSIITSLSGKAIDFYVIAPEITAKEYPFIDAYAGNLPMEFAHGWFRILQPNSVYTLRAFYSWESAPEYKTVITEISGNKVKGSIKFLDTDQGYYTDGTRMVEGTFSTNLLVIE